jgi:hypothetical protein
MATLAKSGQVLVKEEPDAHRMQAQFTRLQMALGLKKGFESNGKLPGFSSVFVFTNGRIL